MSTQRADKGARTPGEIKMLSTKHLKSTSKGTRVHFRGRKFPSPKATTEKALSHILPYCISVRGRVQSRASDDEWR